MTDIKSLDWKFGGNNFLTEVVTNNNFLCLYTVTASSSELNKIGEAFIQLKLVVSGVNADEVVTMGENSHLQQVIRFAI